MAGSYTRIIAEKDVFCADFVHIRNILPEEVWKLVTKKMIKKNIADLEALANSSSFFRILLASQRTTYLFEIVFQLVTSKTWQNEGLEGLQVSSVLNCRRVCSRWSKVIDKLVLQKFQYLGEGSENIQKVCIGNAFKTLLNSSQFTNFIAEGEFTVEPRKSVHNFLRHFERTHTGRELKIRNPLIWETLSLEFIVDEDAEVDGIEQYREFLEGISLLLSKYGGVFTTLKLETFGFQYLENSSVLQHWLMLMPNLKVFNFKNDSQCCLGDDYEEIMFYGASPFPKLAFLEQIYTENLPYPLFYDLIRQNNHISRFLLGNPDTDYDIFTFPLPNLKELEFKCFSDDFVEMFDSLQVVWSLEKLSLFFDLDVGYTALFQIVQNKFAETLLCLDLGMKVAVNEEGPLWRYCNKCRLYLPKLKKVRIDLSKSPVCLDFLMPMKENLEEISASFSCNNNVSQKVTGTSGTIVQFMGFEEKMLDSNIWVIFKKLKKFEVKMYPQSKRSPKSRWYSREDWLHNNVYT